MEVQEQLWRSPANNHLRVLPQAIGVSPRGCSMRLQRVLTDFGSEHSFAKAVAAVIEHYGFAIPTTTVRDATLTHAKRAREKLDAHYQKPFRLLPAEGPKHVVAQLDGTLICTIAPGGRKDKKPRNWEEMRLGAAQVHGKMEVIYAATFGEVEKAGQQWGHCVRDAGAGLHSQIHSMGDGAPWIQIQSKEVFGQQGTFLCDFFHVSEYLAEASLSCRPQAPERWRHTQQKRLKRGAWPLVIEELENYLEPEGTPEENAPVQNCHRYLSNRVNCIDYPNAIKQGLPIGSGMIESGHRHVLQARLKKAGTAWLNETADQIAHLRVLRANGWWEAFWN